MTRPLTIVGDTLLDRDVHGAADRICPDAPVPVLDERRVVSRPGGAGLAALLAAADGRPVTLVTALADDAGGRELRGMLERAGVRVVDLGLTGRTTEKIRLRAGGQSLLRLDRGGGPGTVGPVTGAAAAAVRDSGAVLVADYGRGVATGGGLRELVETFPRAVVWDPHPRGAEPVAGARLVTPNRAELTGAAGGDIPGVTRAARSARRRWRVHGVAVTLGGRGALLVDGAGPPLMVPAPPADASDTCGAGDRFASSAAAALADGALPSEAVEAAVRAASDFVAAGAAAALESVPTDPTGAPAGDAGALADRVRSGGGTVVATGGCFDLLHAGHIALLGAARSLGDCLIVCLNSDASVTRLKGPGRPIVPVADRAAVLLALGCVDAVAVFDEETPAEVLERIRPHIFAKGGDYSGTRLPESEVLEQWGGQTVVLPYLAGRSTTGLLDDATRRGR